MKDKSHIPFEGFVSLQLIIIVVAFIAIFTLGLMPRLVFHNQYVMTVTDKDVKHYKSGNDYEDKYLIFTKNNETGDVRVFENTDSLIPLKFNSSDIYASIEIGKTYEFDVRGLRIPFLSEYQNIYNIQDIKTVN